MGMLYQDSLSLLLYLFYKYLPGQRIGACEGGKSPCVYGSEGGVPRAHNTHMRPVGVTAESRQSLTPQGAIW